MGLNTDFWKDKPVLITGHTGFKGTWLAIWLHELGAKVAGYALEPPTTPSIFNLTGIGQVITSYEGDVRDLEQLKSIIRKQRPEIVFHMAAQPLVRESYANPLETYEINVMGTANLLETIRENANVKAVVNITTDKCYENNEWLWGYRENEPLGGFDPYSSSKACSELVTAAYRRSFFQSDSGSKTAIASARAGNVIGGGDWAKDRLVPDCIRAWLDQKPVSIRYPHAVRPWQHVLDPLYGYLTLAENLYLQGQKFAEAWNFGPNEENATSVRNMVETLAKFWGDDAMLEIDPDESLHEANYLKLDCSKARSRLNWHPQWDLTTALGKTIDWYKTYQLNPEDLLEKSLEQIVDYFN